MSVSANLCTNSVVVDFIFSLRTRVAKGRAGRASELTPMCNPHQPQKEKNGTTNQQLSVRAQRWRRQPLPLGTDHPLSCRRPSDALIARPNAAIHGGVTVSSMPRFVALKVGSCKTMDMVFASCTPMRHAASPEDLCIADGRVAVRERHAARQTTHAQHGGCRTGRRLEPRRRVRRQVEQRVGATATY